MRISEAESHLMEVLWAQGPTSAEDLIRQACNAQNWGEGTARTLISRLLKKKAIGSQRDGGRAIYRPLITRAAYVQTESQGLLDRLFQGELTPLVAHFAEHRALTAEEVENLKALIARIEE